ncbi:hypothetical protein HYH03_012238 [Edaphochlamys debaryana]|uniref:Pherophorin domain-containing protein n=1 Tax=Edaphochlamys debaryana TaxID=47281 RepID=A0A835Y145_9CHLO|nr:hypothetical protein HYH03_012238 [Edaphochlamys debaryana]|eukprot:KAG2489214.1 hypothetical protein HYH03_012238 [Edaphochlamys debaryana]
MEELMGAYNGGSSLQSARSMVEGRMLTTAAPPPPIAELPPATPIPPNCEPYNDFPGYLCPKGNNCTFSPFSLTFAGSITGFKNFTACFTIDIARCPPNNTCCEEVFNGVDRVQLATAMDCIDGYGGMTIGGVSVPSTFDFYPPATASFTATGLAGTGLIQQGAQICVILDSCCKNFAKVFNTNRAIAKYMFAPLNVSCCPTCETTPLSPPPRVPLPPRSPRPPQPPRSPFPPNPPLPPSPPPPPKPPSPDCPETPPTPGNPNFPPNPPLPNFPQ